MCIFEKSFGETCLPSKINKKFSYLIRNRHNGNKPKIQTWLNYLPSYKWTLRLWTVCDRNIFLYFNLSKFQLTSLDYFGYRWLSITNLTYQVIWSNNQWNCVIYHNETEDHIYCFNTFIHYYISFFYPIY